MGTLTLENVCDKVKEIIDEEFLSQLEKDKKRYYNEAQVQHKLGIELYKRFDIEPTLEWCVKNDETGAKKYIDMMLEIGGKKVAIELKYRTKSVKKELYTNQSAQNNGKFNFFKDIKRLEILKNSKDDDFGIEKGFAIFITNDHLYWNAAKEKTSVADFDLCDGTLEKDTYTAEWVDHANEKIEIKNDHPIKWIPTLKGTEKKDGTTFRCLIIEI